jgi:hypothetical protein
LGASSDATLAVGPSTAEKSGGADEHAAMIAAAIEAHNEDVNPIFFTGTSPFVVDPSRTDTEMCRDADHDWCNAQPCPV